MPQRQIHDPTNKLQIRDLNEMFRELYAGGKKLPLSGGKMLGDLDIDGHALKNAVAITNSNGNTYETYPLGLSYTNIDSTNYDQTGGDDFPFGTGTVFTINYNSLRFVQLAFNKMTGEMFMRTYASDSGGFKSWWRVPTSATIGKQLFSGSWGSGNLNVPYISNYTLVIIQYADTGYVSIAVVGGGIVRGVGGGAPSATQVIVGFNATISGNTLTWGSVSDMLHNSSGNHNAGSSHAVTSIIGLI